MAKTPKFASDQEESDFWDIHSSIDYMDDMVEVNVRFVDTRPPQEQVSLQLDQAAITRIKTLAQQRGIGYQMLIRQWVVERLAQEAR